MKRCSRCLLEKEPVQFSRRQSHCKSCCAEKRRAWRAENPGRVKAENLAYRATGYFARYYKENIEAESKRKAIYYANNKELVKGRLDRYAKENPHVRTAITAKRRAMLLQAMPKWANADRIKAIYSQAKAMPEPHEVDHVIPLQGRTVCGLHWEGNLQILPKSENKKKGAKIPCLT